jgi:putative hemolysin
MPDPLTVPTLLQSAVAASQNGLIVAICLVASAFFSGIEIAFLSASKLRIELRSKQGNFTAKILSRYLKNPSDFISTVLVANNLALVIYGVYMGEMLDIAIGTAIHSNLVKFLIITVVSTLIVLITAEFIPKSLFRINPDSLLFSLAIPFRIFHILLWPLIYLVKKTSAFLLRVFTKTVVTESTPVFTKVDLDNYFSALENTTQNEFTEIDTEVFRNALDFSDVKVRDFMVPRTELVALDITEPIEALQNLFISSSHSRILVYRDNIDNIIGFAHHSEAFSKPKTVQQMLKPLLIVNESMQAHDLLRDFIQKHRSIAVVVDEFGGTAGIATMEDVMEEIFGEIEDEYDVEGLTESIIANNHYLFSARHEIHYLNDKYDLNLPEGDYNTLGGFVIAICERIPRQREVIRQGPWEFLVTKVRGARIDEVELTVHSVE